MMQAEVAGLVHGVNVGKAHPLMNPGRFGPLSGTSYTLEQNQFLLDFTTKTAVGLIDLPRDMLSFTPISCRNGTKLRIALDSKCIKNTLFVLEKEGIETRQFFLGNARYFSPESRSLFEDIPTLALDKEEEKQVLDLVAFFPEKQKKEILARLLLAGFSINVSVHELANEITQVENYPEILQRLLPSLTPDQIYDVLMIRNKKGFSLFSFFVEKTNDSTILSKALADLKPNKIKRLFSQQYYCTSVAAPYPYVNMLTECMIRTGFAIATILEISCDLPLRSKDRAWVLKKVLIDRDTNVLKCIVTCFSKKIESRRLGRIDSIVFVRILRAVQRLPEAELRSSIFKTILTAKSEDGLNLLMGAAKWGPISVRLILEGVQHLPEKDQPLVLKEMLQSKDTDGDNALVLAATHKQPEAVQAILEAAHRFFAEEEKISVLKRMMGPLLVLSRNSKFSEAVVTTLTEFIRSYTVLRIHESGRSFGKLVAMLPRSEQKNHLFSLYEFIKRHRIPSHDQLVGIKNWFLFEETVSRDEKATLLRIKPSQLARLILNGLDGEDLKIQTFNLLSLLLSSTKITQLTASWEPHLDMEALSERIRAISERLSSSDTSTAIAARSVMNTYSRTNSRTKKKPSGSRVLTHPRHGSSDGRELNSFAPGGGGYK